MRYFLAIALFVTWSGISSGQARRVDDPALRNAAKSASDGDWLTYGLTPGETVVTEGAVFLSNQLLLSDAG